MYAPYDRQQQTSDLLKHQDGDARGEAPEAGDCDRHVEGGQVPIEETKEGSEGQDPQQPGHAVNAQEHVTWLAESWGWDGQRHYQIGIE